MARFGSVRSDWVRTGRVWLVEATVADSSTEGLCSPCCSLRRVDMARSGKVRLVSVGWGWARLGSLR